MANSTSLRSVPSTAASARHKGSRPIATRAAPDEKRRHPRRAGRFDIWLLHADGEIVLRCRADNVSASGLRALVLPGSDVRWGQRFRVHMCPASPWSGFGAATRVLGDATVVRVEYASSREGQTVELGLHFDSAVTWLRSAELRVSTPSV